MYKTYGDGSLADRRCHTLEAARAHVARRKYAGETRFEQARCSRQRPLRSLEDLGGQVRAGPDKAFVIQGHTRLQPGRARLSARHQKHVADVARFGGTACSRAPADPFKVFGSLESF